MVLTGGTFSLRMDEKDYFFFSFKVKIYNEDIFRFLSVADMWKNLLRHIFAHFQSVLTGIIDLIFRGASFLL